MTDSDYDYILEEIGRRDKIEFEIDVEVYMIISNEYYTYLLYIDITNIIIFYQFPSSTSILCFQV